MVLGMFSFSVMGPNGHVWSSHASVLICYYKLTKASKSSVYRNAFIHVHKEMCTTCNNEKLQIIQLFSMNYNHKAECYIATKIKELELEELKRMTLMVSNRAKHRRYAP